MLYNFSVNYGDECLGNADLAVIASCYNMIEFSSQKRY